MVNIIENKCQECIALRIVLGEVKASEVITGTFPAPCFVTTLIEGPNAGAAVTERAVIVVNNNSANGTTQRAERVTMRLAGIQRTRFTSFNTRLESVEEVGSLVSGTWRGGRDGGCESGLIPADGDPATLIKIVQAFYSDSDLE